MKKPLFLEATRLDREIREMTSAAGSLQDLANFPHQIRNRPCEIKIGNQQFFLSPEKSENEILILISMLKRVFNEEKIKTLQNQFDNL